MTTLIRVFTTLLICSCCLPNNLLPAEDGSRPIVATDLVFAEKDGLVAVEAEHFFDQTEKEKRAFYLTTQNDQPEFEPDGDPPHVGGASGGAYLEILPDTRRNHGERLMPGQNFSNEPGKLAILHYKVHITNPGRYYVWVRAYSSGSEDNGLHVGLDGSWPETGQRLQWCEGKQSWWWESKQRTEKEHCGVPHQIYLDIKNPGEHTIHFSMREDGFEFDKWLMTKNREFVRPMDTGPDSIIHAGTTPEPFPFVAAPKQEQETNATEAAAPAQSSLVMSATDFSIDGTNYYVDNSKWLAINPDVHKTAKASKPFPFPAGTYDITLRTVGENDGQSKYRVTIGDRELGEFKNQLSEQMYEEGPQFLQRWQDVKIGEKATIAVSSTVGSKDGDEFSRARWSALTFKPADEATRRVAEPFLVAQPTPAAETNQSKRSTDSSPTKPVSDKPLIEPRQPDGDGSISISGDVRVWHKVTFTLAGPYAHEQDNDPNPFTDYRMEMEFRHTDGTTYVVPGYFAADGNAAETSAEAGTQWRTHFAPDREGRWHYVLALSRGTNLALSTQNPGVPLHRVSGTFFVEPSNKTGRDLRNEGRLDYVGKRYLQHAGSKNYFLKVGADAPETLLAYADFDNTVAGKPKQVPLKKYTSHVKDWQDGDPTWQDGRGKGLIGAINYLSGKGCNAFSFLTYNAGGDGDDVWPFIHRDDKLHYDCSKLDQWGIVFDHGTQKGMYLHFKMQETENDDHAKGQNDPNGFVPESLDGGNLGPQRKLYCRELIARFGHNLALNWNLGEENTQTTAQQQAMIDYISQTDPYGHNIVVHTFPEQQDKVYRALIGNQSKLTGLSLQNNDIKDTHSQTVKWVRASKAAGKSLVVAFDESGSAAHGQCPDLGYRGFDGTDSQGKMIYTQHEVRRQTLWGNLMGGGAGVEYYFGYKFAENDLVCEDWRSRDQSWDYCRIAINFFHENKIPFQEMQPMDELVGNPDHDNSRYCLAQPNEIYLVYFPNGGKIELDLTQADGLFTMKWFNPREGGELIDPEKTVSAGRMVNIQCIQNDNQDWLLVLARPSPSK